MTPSAMPWRPALLTVLGFFSRLPVPVREGALAPAVWILPLAAVVIALPAAALALVALAVGLPGLAVAVAATLALTATTGALHEDGLADCADGFWGGGTVTRRLAIMRDSHVGTYGVLALVGAVLLKAALLDALIASGPATATTALVAAAVAGRTVALYPWVGLPPARTDGLAAAAGRPTPTHFRLALALAIALCAALTAWISPLGFVAAGVCAAAGAIGVARLADAKIGGHTGDVIGAAVIVGDLSYLAAFAIFL